MAPPKMPPIENMADMDENTNLLVYADSGVGKTVLAGTAGPKGLIVAIDKGTVSAKINGSQCRVVRCHDWSDIEATQKWLRAGGYKEFDWVTWDGLTMMREKAMYYVLDMAVAENDKRDPFIPAQQDHQKVQLMMKKFVEHMCDLPVDTLFTALPMNIETQDGDEKVVPQIHGQKGDLSQYICGLMSAYGHMKVTTSKRTGQKVRRITWAPTGSYTGKDRFGVLAPFTDDITLPEIKARIVASQDVGGSTGSSRRSTTRPATRRTASTTRRRRTA